MWLGRIPILAGGVSGETTSGVDEWVGHAADAVEILGVSILVLGIVWATGRHGWFLVRAVRGVHRLDAYRRDLGGVLLLALEILIGADVLQTVSVDFELESLAALAAIVVLRAFVSVTLTLEIEQRWPWQPAHMDRPAAAPSTPEREL